MRRKLVMIVAAVVCGVLGTALLVNWLRGAESRAVEGKELVDVLVAQQQIPSGTSVEEMARLNLVSAMQVPAEVRPQGAVVRLEDLVGQVASTDILPGEQLVRARFVAVADYDSRPSAVEVPAGMVEISVPTSADRLLGGLLTPGERVMVIATFPGETYDQTQAVIDGEQVNLPDAVVGENVISVPAVTHVLMHKVLVTEVQVDTLPTMRDPVATTGPAGPILASSSEITLTLALTPPEAERMVYALEHGQLWYAAEGDDVPEEGTRFQTRATVFEDTDPAPAR